jgi:uncharacterized repeat protein (TIGR03803 family)
MKRIRFVCLFLCLTNLAARPAHAAATETVLYNFCSQPNCGDGAYPRLSGLTSYNGNFYGTTEEGGANGVGTVFELSPNGSGGYNETVLYSFCSVANCADGQSPLANVIFDNLGNMYGTTGAGGANNIGAVFELNPAGSSWTETVLYSFTGASGANPAGGLITDPAGNLYGTNQDGYVFELSPSDGSWTEQTIYSSSQIAPGLTMDAAGNIFGASYRIVFELSPNGSGGWNPTVIHTFTGGTKDGYDAFGTPVLDSAGNLYGTTYEGGAHDYGTVWKLTPVTTGKKKGTWTEKLLHSFKGGTKDGSVPYAGVVLDASGNIYGTTTYGGKYGLGTVFELAAPAAGKTAYTEKILWSFNLTDGEYPYDSLILDGSNLYGTTYYGGSSGYGVVFEVTP